VKESSTISLAPEPMLTCYWAHYRFVFRKHAVLQRDSYRAQKQTDLNGSILDEHQKWKIANEPNRHIGTASNAFKYAIRLLDHGFNVSMLIDIRISVNWALAHTVVLYSRGLIDPSSFC
jgi:hypothetical protein